MLEIRPGFRYTKAQMRTLTEEQAKQFQAAGLVLRLDDQGYYSLVHHTAAFGGKVLERKEHGTLERSNKLEGQASFSAPAPIQKRTPQERLESMVSRMWPGVKDLGHIPGLKEDDVLTVVLNAKGRAEKKDLTKERMTAEDVREVAGALLTQSEKEHEEKLSKQITRHED